jgi:alcohol dehydrogenase class IV
VGKPPTFRQADRIRFDGHPEVGAQMAAEILARLRFSTEEIPMLARMAFEDPQTIGNPREMDVADYEGIYEASFAS